MYSTNRILVILVTLLLGLFSVQSFAQSDNANPAAFGVGKPVHILDLPDSAFRKNLLSLPPQARATALKWMQGFNFPAADVKYLRTTPSGEIYYADTFLPPKNATGESEAPITPNAIAPSETLRLHSRPNSDNVLFLDFDGHVITGTAWNGTYDPLVAKAFDNSTTDDDATFTDSELETIGEIWHRMAEDFAPWDIDVTTEEPTTFTNTMGRVLFTDDVDENGNAMPSAGGGGVAYVGVFDLSNYVSRYSPALVYHTNLGPNFAPFMAEAGTHEFGHNIGMGHDGTSEVGYYEGHGLGLVSWGPIMGVGYYTNVTQWSKGEYTDANNQEDDLALITNDLGYIADDHGDASASATELIVEANGDILVSSPELDPHNDMPQNKGIINNRTDVDWFYVDVGAGPLTIIVSPAWHSFLRSSRRGANLDVELTLYNSGLTELGYDEPIDDTFATVTLASVVAGRYFIKIDGTGNNTDSDYSDYDSLGMYFIEGTVTPVSLDSTKPSPNPMTFAFSPAATGAYSIAMTASTATDDSGFVEYQFACQGSHAGCVTSDWQTSTDYTATGLDPNTLYSYVVRARDSSQNTTADSSFASATTGSPPPDAPTGFSATTASQTQINLTWTDASNDEDVFNLRRSTDQTNWDNLPNAATNATSFNDSNGLTSGTQYFYEIRSFSTTNGSSAWVPANATTLEDAPDGTPTGLAATAISTSQIDLIWTDQASNESSYKIERSADGSSGWSNIGSEAPNTQAFSDTGLVSGATWYYRVGAYTTGGTNYSDVVNATTNFECTTGPITPATSTWIMFSLPCKPANNTVGSIIPLPDEDYGSRWVVYYYNNDPNGTNPGYEKLELGSPMYESMGYFFYTFDEVTLTIAGANNTGADIDLRTDSADGAFNLVGTPRNGTTAWPDVVVMDGTTEVSLADADKQLNSTKPYYCDVSPAPRQCLMSREMHKWNGVSYTVFDGESPMFGDLEAFDVVWVKAFKQDIMLRIPAPLAATAQGLTASAANENSSKKVKDSKTKDKPKPWHVRLIAESGPHADRGNFLGQQTGTIDGQDRRDLEEPAPFGNKYLSVLFTNPDFEPVDWGYTSDFRELTGTSQGEWTFVVKASDEFEQVTLRWEGEDSLFANAILIDEVSGETIIVAPGGSYTFSLIGNEHPFRIILN